MCDILSNEFIETLTELLYYIDTEVLFHLAANSHYLPEIALTQLLDDVVIIGSLFEIKEADDMVGMDLP